MTCSLYRAATPEQAGPYGFYDDHNQVVVIPSLRLPPHVVVDHEITHVNLVNNSALGRLEQAILFTQNLAYAAGAKPAGDRIWLDFGQVINQRSEQVHEATAWYGTELQTATHEKLAAPAKYASLIRRIRAVVEGRGLPDFGASPGSGPGSLDIAEDAAIYALDSPVVARLWSDPARIRPETLTRALSEPHDDPVARMHAVLSWLAGLSTAQMTEWSRSREPGADRGGVPVPVSSRRWRGTQQIPVTELAELPETGTVEVITAIARHAGLFPAFQPEGGRAALDTRWKLARAVETFSRRAERYAQVCVVEPTSQPSAVQAAELPPDEARAATRLIVGIAPPVQTLPDQPPWADLAHVIYHVPGAPPRAWLSRREAVHEFLADRQRAAAVIATSRGYDLAACDYDGVLAGVEHAVMALTDVRSLLFRLTAAGGLGSSAQLELDVLRSPRLGSDYGYLLVKAAGRVHPVIIVPIIAAYAQRITGFLQSGQEEDVALGRAFAQARGGSPPDLVFSPASQPRPEWIGPLARHVTAAVSLFERWDQPG